MWCLANKEFSSNVAIAFACSLTRGFSVLDVSLTSVNTIEIFTFNLAQDSSGSLFLDLVFWLFKYAWDCLNRLQSDLYVEASKNFCDPLGESFDVGQDNHATLVGIAQFLLSIW